VNWKVFWIAFSAAFVVVMMLTSLAYLIGAVIS
jgi:hypothetical protein